MKNKSEIIVPVIVGILTLVFVGLFAYFGSSGGVVKNDKTGLFEGQMSLEKLSEISTCPLTSDKDSFAKCLTEKGWTMYGAKWCSHCQAQKDLFGDSFQYVTYVECPDNAELCVAEGINGYPTWKVKK